MAVGHREGGIELRVIYVSALPVPRDVVNYYYKLLELGGEKDFRKKIFLMAP